MTHALDGYHFPPIIVVLSRRISFVKDYLHSRSIKATDKASAEKNVQG